MNQGHYNVSSPHFIDTFQNYFPENLQLLSDASGHMVSDLFQITFNRCLARELARHNPLPANPSITEVSASRAIFYGLPLPCQNRRERGSIGGIELLISNQNFPCDSARKESPCNAGDLGLIPGLGRFPGRKEGLPTPVFWPGEFHELYSPRGGKESDIPEQLSLYFNQNLATHKR